jgi:hypothetical protein
MDISAREADQLGPGLKRIRHVTFCDNSIGLHEGTLEVLVALLLCCGFLESTYIIRNSLTDNHVPSLVALMKRHRTLTHLSLAWNGITDRGSKKLASALEELRSSLRSLDISYNQIGEKGKAVLERVAKKRSHYFGPSANPIDIFMNHNENVRDVIREQKEAAAAAASSCGGGGAGGGGGGVGGGNVSPSSSNNAVGTGPPQQLSIKTNVLSGRRSLYA